MRFASVLALALLGGCGLTLDLDPPDQPIGIDGGTRDGGAPDAGPRSDGGTLPCEGRPDGSVCDEVTPRICLGGQCVRSRCGDGFVHAAGGELCEDGNEISGDGCEPGSCRYSCESDVDCAARECATASCTEHVCVSVPRENAGCTLATGLSGRCESGACVPAMCGDGSLHAGEACDDGNDVAQDGCEPDCSLICDAMGCSDGVECNGMEMCLLSSGPDGQTRATCQGGTPTPTLSCEACDLLTGRVTLIDADGDGYAAGDDPDCAGRNGDCAPSDPAIHPGAPDFAMPGDHVDNDCDGMSDEDLVSTCYRDADGDGYGVREGSVPVDVAAICPEGFVPAPVDTMSFVTDCDDADADVFPGQTAWFATSRCDRGVSLPPGALCWDYDCDGVEVKRWPRPASCLAVLGRCNDQGWSLLDGVVVPACGARGAWTRCANLGLACLPGATITRPVQECH